MRVLGIVAVLILIGAGVLAVRGMADVRERRGQINQLMRDEQVQAQARDYAGAWGSLEKALTIATTGDIFARLTKRLDPDAQLVRDAQEGLAIAWTENLHVGEGEKYSAIVDRLVPVMTRGAASTTGRQKADLLAHAAFATFHKSLDGVAVSDLTPQYRAALAEDPTNPYGHVFLGHWLTWSGGSLVEAQKEFDAVTASGQVLAFVRRVQREALRKRGHDADPALLALASQMRKSGEPIDAGLRDAVDAVYDAACGGRENPEAMRRLLSFSPPAEQVVTFRRLFYDHAGRSLDEAREIFQGACLATLLEAAGQPQDALQAWRRVRQGIGPGSTTGNPLTPRADAAIRRLRAATR
jgi:hypothetical protein